MTRLILTLIILVLSLNLSKAQRHKLWLDLSGGPTFTDQSLTIFAPGMAVTMLTNSGLPLRVKGSYHVTPAILSDASWSVDVGFMTGGIRQEGKRTMEAYVGLGYITGLRTGEYYPGWGWIPLGHYEMVPFRTVGVPVEVRAQWRVLGVGFDANINEEMPYFGIKYFVRIGLVKFSP